MLITWIKGGSCMWLCETTQIRHKSYTWDNLVLNSTTLFYVRTTIDWIISDNASDRTSGEKPWDLILWPRYLLCKIVILKSSINFFALIVYF